MQNILITGITGFIGKAVLRKILLFEAGLTIHAIVRPHTPASRYKEFEDKISISFVDLADSKALTLFLDKHRFDTIIHVGALRGGRKFSREQYFLSNVTSVEVIIEYCLKNKTKLLFCSSVGVFGAIPQELPANNFSPRIDDNYYHYSKIEAEKRINKAIISGLKAAILRPSITYGVGDYGFPYQLVKMIRDHRFPLISKKIWIHLCHIDTISDAFTWLLHNDFMNGLSLNVADREPVQLRDLVNFISRQLSNRNYSTLMQFDQKLFTISEKLFRLLKDELWISRIELISKSWFYDVNDLYRITNIRPRYTIPEIELVVREFKK